MYSSLSQGQHSQLLTAILDYLKRLEMANDAVTVADKSQLSDAISKLELATGLASSASSNFSITPHTLETIFASAGIQEPVRWE